MEVKPLCELRGLMQQDDKNNSLAKKHLTEEIVKKYSNVKSSLGGTLAQCVNTNAYNPGALLPRCADMECYETFKDFFDKVIKDYHKVKGDTISHPKSNFGDLSKLSFGDLDPSGQQVVSTRVRCGRTVKGYAFAPVISKEKREELENKIASALSQLPGEYAGTYYPLLGMKKADQDQLVADHFLFRDDDSVLRDAGGYRDWPSGRGIYINNDKTFLVWVSEEDHIRIISMQKGGDLATVYKRLATAVDLMSKALEFAFSDKLGFITFCPSNLGTTLRASVHAKVPLLSSLPNFKEICEGYGIQARGTFGEHTESVGGVYDLSNKRRLGLTELDAVEEMAKGVKALLELEKKLSMVNDTKIPVPPVESLACMRALLANAEDRSLAKRYLTEEMVKKYEGKRSAAGTLLAHCVRNCAYNGRAICPRTGDADCYEVFKDFLDAVIKDYHSVKEDNFKHPPPTFGDLNNLPFGDLDPSGKYVVSTRVRVGRSVAGYQFPPTISKESRLKMEKDISTALKCLTGEHAGTYYPLAGMSPGIQRQLIDDHFLFKNDDPVLRDAFGYRDWPSGRGIFHNEQKTFLVWVCEEDHMRIISMQKGGDLAAVYKRLISGIQAVEAKVPFVHSDKYGYLTCCPSNLGTTMRASVHVKVPKLSSNKTKFQEVCDKYNLQARGFHGEHTESADGIYDISNKRRLGLTELQAATEMANGVAEIIKIECGL